MMKRIIGTIAVFAALTASSATAAGFEEFSLYPTIQYFTWKEYDSGGARLLKEDGPLFGVGGTATLDLHDNFLFLRGKAELFGGQVDYDGQTTDTDPRFDRLPVKSDVNYFGGKIETDFSWRLPGPDGSLEPFAGLGYRHWLRNIEASSTQTRDAIPVAVQTSSATEEWLSLYARLGVRGTYRLSDSVRISLEGGARYPFLNRNYAEAFGQNVTLEPRGSWSAFGELSTQFGRFRPAVYYEGFRFGKSPTVAAYDPVNAQLVGILQPESSADIIGFSFSFLFR
ncbi:autotransporter outer membrane beta-barrel domain-containing protein [Geobacter pickeringii]|nr:autotransporter outer membrane beta-barrel domain-containing protein [Geobacter pickeringii]